MRFCEKVKIRDIVKYFGFTQLTGDDSSLERWVVVPDLNRPGLELAGYNVPTEPRRIILLGDKEQEYIKTLTEEVQKERFDFITDGLTPMILITHGNECPKTLEGIAKAKNFPVFVTKSSTFRIMVDLITYLDECLAPSDSLHAVLLNVYGIGVLIMGESGMGKSEIALELIRRGHVLVADDRVDVMRVHNKIIGRPADLLLGMLEIRGIGIIDVAKMFGASSLLTKNNVDMVIHLEPHDPTRDYTRVGNEAMPITTILGVDIPSLVLPVKVGRSMAVLVESAVTDFRLKESGYNSAREFEKRVYDYIEEQNRERFTKQQEKHDETGDPV